MVKTEPGAVYRQPAEAVVAVLGSDAERGLTAEDARRRLPHFGRNELAA
jgi:hypothetical protein